MRVLNSKPTILTLLIVAAFTLVGCGKSKNNSSLVNPYGLANGVGVGVGGAYGNGQVGCIPIQAGAQIPLQFNSVYVNSAMISNLQGGAGGYPSYPGQTTAPTVFQSGQSGEAFVQLQAAINSTVAAPQTVPMSGTAMLTQYGVNALYAQMQMMGGGGYYPYPNTGYPNTGYPNQQVSCITAVQGIDASRYGNTLHSGFILVTLNNGISAKLILVGM